jgi:hypothetical protein
MGEEDATGRRRWHNKEEDDISEESLDEEVGAYDKHAPRRL